MYFGLGFALEGLGSYSESKAAYRRALEMSKGEASGDAAQRALRGLIRSTAALHQSAETETWFQELVNRGMAEASDWEGEATRLEKSDKYSEAGEACLKAAGMGGAWNDWCLAAVSLSDDKPDDALSSARKCIEAGTGKDNSEKSLSVAHQIIAHVLNSRGVYSEALANAREATDLDPTSEWNFEALAKALYGLRRFQEAINASNQAIRLSDGKYSEMHFLLGNSYFALENWEFARQSYEKAAELAPTDTAAPYNLALCFSRLGYSADAAKWFEEVLRRNPNSPDRADILRRIALLRGATR